MGAAFFAPSFISKTVSDSGTGRPASVLAEKVSWIASSICSPSSTGAFDQDGESRQGGRPFADFFATVKLDGIVRGLHDESEVVCFDS